MITGFSLRNFGPTKEVTWRDLSKINLIIGSNGHGKTFLLKALYSAVRTLEEYKRGDVQSTAAEILLDKLQWTFQADKVGDLVTKGVDGHLDFRMTLGRDEFCYTFGKDTSRQIQTLENHAAPRTSNSIFLPAKEVLSLHHIILKSREVDKVYGFDDTYLDLTRALRQSGRGGRNYEAFAKSRGRLEDLLGGKVEDVDGTGKWVFRKGKYRFPLSVTAEGVKKIAILDTLLSNRYLDPQSIVFIDEVESALHPAAITKLLDIIAALADCGIQFIMASHSYFVVKKLFLLAQERGLSIPVLAGDGEGWKSSNLQQGMPENAIIQESIRLYEEEVGLAFA